MADGTKEYGLLLTYASDTGTTPGSIADVAWTYDVSGVPSLTDAFAELAGTTIGTGTSDLSEILSNGDSLSLAKPGTVTSIFTAIASLSVIKDQSDFAGSAGSADSSVLGNAFSVMIPEPSTWAMMLLGFAGMGFVGYRARQAATASA
jgi:hypothetical protein